MRRRGLLPLVFIVLVAVVGVVLTFTTDSEPTLGLDLQGGASVVLSAQGDVDDGTLDEAVEIIRRRVDALGVAEPVIARQGDNVVVELPGVDNQQRALELVGDTAELEFRPVCELLPPFGAPEPTTTTTTGGGEGASTTTTAAGGSSTTVAAGGTSTTAEQSAGLFGSVGELAGGGGTTTAPGDGGDATTTTTAPVTASTIDPATASTVPGATGATGEGGGEPCPSGLGTGPNRNLCAEPQEDSRSDGFIVLPECDEDGNEVIRYRVGPTALTGRSLSGADAALGGATGNEWTVNPVFKSGEENIDAFNAAAALCFGGDPSCPPQASGDPAQQPVGQLAIVLDNVVVSAPGIETASFERDQITISGAFDESSAKDLATVLKYGSLPVELETQAVQTVSPSLGEDSLRAGLLAGAIGIAAVCLYMVLYYRALGLAVILSLGVWTALNWTLLCLFSVNAGLALTLAGVTGLVVSIGVTVDSYVVYFERIIDDVRAGKSLRSSTGKSFNKAFNTILTANVAAVIGAVLLYLLTVGPVRGFALFLGLATVLDVIVAYMFTRPLVGLMARSRFFTEARFFGVARNLRRLAAEAEREGPQPAPASTGGGGEGP